jgi:hypothetical protein
MDSDQQVQVIEARLDALEGMAIRDDLSAREAFTHVMVTVNRINQLLATTQAQAVMGAATPIDKTLEKLRDWLDRLVTAMRRTLAKLAGATAFSVSVGTSVSVTVDFGPARGRASFSLSGRPYGPGLD